ncbi:MAG: RIP metalloprotease RseP [Candidatus Omnitrophota bacterium]
MGLIFCAVIILAVFSCLVIAHELGHFAAARRSGVRVERFAVGFGRKIFGIKRGDTEYLVNIIPLGGYVKLAGEDPAEAKGKSDELCSKPILSRFWIFVSGSLANVILAYVVLLFLYLVGIPTPTSDIGRVLDKSPAAAAGIMAGDRIVAIDGKPVKYWSQVLETIRSNTDAKPMSIGIERGREALGFSITPSVITATNVFKQEVRFPGIGIAPSENIVLMKSNPLNAVTLSAEYVWFFTAATYKGIWRILTGAMPVRESVGGPIRIVQVLAKAIEHGPVSVFSMMANISLALAIFNLLPFPVLDGGHILFLCIEKLRGKPLSAKTQEMISQVALVLLIAFFVYVSYCDTVGIVAGKK